MTFFDQLLGEFRDWIFNSFFIVFGVDFGSQNHWKNGLDGVLGRPGEVLGGVGWDVVERCVVLCGFGRSWVRSWVGLVGRPVPNLHDRGSPRVAQRSKGSLGWMAPPRSETFVLVGLRGFVCCGVVRCAVVDAVLCVVVLCCVWVCCSVLFFVAVLGWSEP